MNLSQLAKEAASSAGVPARLLRYYAPIGDRRHDFTPEEQTAVSEGESQWLPKLIQTDSTPIPEMMASPGKQSVLAGLLGGAAGGGIGYAIGGARGAALGGLGGAAVGGLGRFLHQKKENEHLAETMRRLPIGATKRDYDAERMLGDAFVDKYGQDKAAKFNPGFAAGAITAATSSDTPRRPAMLPDNDPPVPPDDVRRLGEILGRSKRGPRRMTRRQLAKEAASLLGGLETGVAAAEKAIPGVEKALPGATKAAPALEGAAARLGQAAETAAPTIARAGTASEQAAAQATQNMGGGFHLPGPGQTPPTAPTGSWRQAMPSFGQAAKQNAPTAAMTTATNYTLNPDLTTTTGPDGQAQRRGWLDPVRVGGAAAAGLTALSPVGARTAIGENVGMLGDVGQHLVAPDSPDYRMRYVGAGLGAGSYGVPMLNRAAGTTAAQLGEKGLGAANKTMLYGGGLAVGGDYLANRGRAGVMEAGDMVKKDIMTSLGQNPNDNTLQNVTVAESQLDKHPEQFATLYPDVAKAATDPATGQFDPNKAKEIFKQQRMGVAEKTLGVQPGTISNAVNIAKQFTNPQTGQVDMDYAVKTLTDKAKSQITADPEFVSNILVQATGKKPEEIKQMLSLLGGGAGGGMAGMAGMATQALGWLDGIANKVLGLFGMNGQQMSTTQKVLVMLGGIGMAAGGIAALTGSTGLGAGIGAVGALGIAAGVFGDKLGIGKPATATPPPTQTNPTVVKPVTPVNQPPGTFMTQAAANVTAAGVPAEKLYLGPDGRPTSDDPAVKQLLDVKLQDPEFAKNVSEMLQAGGSAGGGMS